MAYFYRLIFVLFSVFFTNFAMANFTTYCQANVSCNAQHVGGNWSTDPDVACSKRNAGSVWGGLSDDRCFIGGDPNLWFGGLSKFSNSDCVSPQTPDVTGVCSSPPPPPCDVAGSTLSKSYPVKVGDSENDANLVCFGGCEYTLLSGSAFVGTKNEAGLWEYNRGLNASTGNSCTGNAGTVILDPPPELSVKDKCLAAGDSFGQVNGVDVCVPRLTAGATPTKSSDASSSISASSDGSSTSVGVTSSSVTNIDGSVTTTTITNTTITNSQGVSSTTSETTAETDSGDGFCQKNPNAELCKNSDKSKFSGSCAANFSCDGDAIQCAISKEQHLRNCTFFDNSTPESVEGQKMIDGTSSSDLLNPAKLSNREIVDVAGMVNEGSNIGGGSFTDKTISMSHGGSIVLPFSRLNFIMNILGGFLLAGSYLNAARIVGVRK